MAVTIKEVNQAFYLLHGSLLDRKFAKSSGFELFTERALLPLVRFFLLGFFWVVEPEATVRLPTSQTGEGKIDFLVGKVAVEFAVRRPQDGPSKVSKSANEGEIIKLIKHDGPAVLVLFDFSDAPRTSADLEEYRDLPSLGQGKHSKSPFRVLYYYSDDKGNSQVISKQIRVRV